MITSEILACFAVAFWYGLSPDMNVCPQCTYKLCLQYPAAGKGVHVVSVFTLIQCTFKEVHVLLIILGYKGQLRDILSEDMFSTGSLPRARTHSKVERL
jgi:hypothetical protein